MALIDFLASGVTGLSLTGKILVVLVTTHLTILGVTVFLHRCQAHRALDLHPAVAHFFRFWLWLTTGMVTREWVAVHRRHHARCEGPEDPHSPNQVGIGKVLGEGAELYRAAAADPATLEQFGKGTPDDWLERNLYGRYHVLGVSLLLVAAVVLFGAAGVAMWAVQMLWIPVLAAGVINGLGHWWGYRNYEVQDRSTNIVPWGLLIGGEELHNNHHAFASSARFSCKWWELDVGWVWIRTLSALRLATVRRVAPRLYRVPAKSLPDLDTLKAIVSGRIQVTAAYARTVVRRVHREELARFSGSDRRLMADAHKLLIREDSLLCAESRVRLQRALARSQTLRTVYDFRQRLMAIWSQRSASQEKLLEALQEWCRQAESTGIKALEDFSRQLRSYAIQPQPA